MRPLPLPHPGTPPLRTPWAYLRWVAGHQRWLLLAAVAVGVVGNVAGALLPYAMGRAVDGGLARGVSGELLAACALLGAIGMVQVACNVVGHRLDVENWLRGAYVSSQLIGHHVTRTGDRITEELPTGEVVATVAGDALRVGELYAVAARFIGGIVAYGVVTAAILRTSVSLGLTVLIGLPAAIAALGLLVRPLQRRQAAQREEAGRLTTLGADTVSELRVLRGIGGEEVFAGRYIDQSQKVRSTGVRVAQLQSVVDALQTLLPGLFVAFVVWTGARLAIAGEISPGQLVTLYGFAAFLTQPLWIATEAVRIVARATVGARKIIGVLAVPEVPGEQPATASPPVGSELTDPASGLLVRPGVLTALVSDDPAATAGIAMRLGRLSEPAGSAAPAGSRTAGTAGALSGVRLGPALLRELGLAEVRHRVVVAESTPHLFTGTLSAELDVRGDADREDLYRALAVADAADVLDSVPGGLDGELAEKGRSLSGGQRQRVALARALLTGAEVLILVEPTSAVDAHTEARIARRLARARRGLTTVVVSTSPLVLEVADEVAVVTGGTVRTTGTHHDLLRRADSDGATYRSIVSRGEDSHAVAHR